VALPKVYRLKSRKDFQAVFREGIRRHGPNFTLRALRASQAKISGVEAALTSAQQTDVFPLQPPKIGISVSTKVNKRAVVRNRLKRQISAAIYQLLPKMKPGWRLVVVVKPTIVESKCVTQEFLQELEQLLAQAEVLDGHS
jgi:ribonuclease P protein component